MFSPIYGEHPTEYRLPDLLRKYKRVSDERAKSLWCKALRLQRRDEYVWKKENEIYVISGNFVRYLKVILENSNYGDSVHLCEVRFSNESLIGLRVSS